MTPNIAFHHVTSLKPTPVLHYQASGNHPAFWTRNLILCDDKGKSFCLPLYADTADGLCLPGEVPDKAIEATIAALGESPFQQRTP